MKYRILVVVLFCVFSLKAQTQKELADKYLEKRGELVFTFTANNFKEIEQLNRIISFDRGRDRNNPFKVNAVANKKNFEKFLAFNLPFEVNVKANEPKEVIMFDPKIHKKGVSGKNTAYPLSFPLSTYPTYQQYADQMAAFAADHPLIAQLVDIGGTSGTSSVNPRLLFIKLSDNISIREKEPRVMYTSTMHGDETAGYPGMLNLIDYFITAYEDTGHVDHTRIKNLLDNTEVWINPMANPEGTFYGSSTYTSVTGSRRANANNVDLNRNYPDNVGGAHPDSEAYQTETLAFMQFASDYHFVISANFHGGIELVNYPFDNAYASDYTHPDTNWFEFVSVEYASQAQSDSPSGYMTTDEDSHIFPSPGVTHGAEWYRVYGGRQDYMNFYHQCREITVEISDVKRPPSTNTSSNNEVIDIWNYNQEAYIKFLLQGMYGFRGVVKDASTGDPIDAKITIVGRDDKATPVTKSWVETETMISGLATGLGDFYRPIEAGNYDILIEAECYSSVTLTNQSITNYQTINLGDILLSSATANAPSGLSESNVTATTATLNWEDANVTSYDIWYKQQGASTWIETTSSTNSKAVSSLTANTTYEYQVRGICNGTPSSWSSIETFTTTTVIYCPLSGSNIGEEYISNVELGGINNNTQSTTSSGYSDFTGSNIFGDLDLNSSVSISVTKYWTSTKYREAIAVWIDFDKDGVFETLEKVFNSTSSNTPTVGSSFTVPNTATLGNTRMRVILKYFNSSGQSVSNACAPFNYGEVEDYTVNIIDSTLGIQDELLSTFTLYPNPTNIGEVKLTLPNEIEAVDVLISNVLGQKLVVTKLVNRANKIHTISTSNLKTGVYFITISTELGRSTKKMIVQ